MNIRFNCNKNIVKILMVLTLVLGVESVAYTSTYGNSMNGASNEEVLQVRYNGAAWNYSASGYN